MKSTFFVLLWHISCMKNSTAINCFCYLASCFCYLASWRFVSNREGKTPHWSKLDIWTKSYSSHDTFKIIYNLSKNFIVNEWLKKPNSIFKEILNSLYYFVTCRLKNGESDSDEEFLTSYALLNSSHFRSFLEDQHDQLRRYHSDIKNYQFSYLFQVYRQGGDELLTGGRLMNWSILHSEVPHLGNPNIGSFSDVRVLKHKLLY